MAAISAMLSPRRKGGRSAGIGKAWLLAATEIATASVATAIAAMRILFFIRAERYAGWVRVSMARCWGCWVMSTAKIHRRQKHLPWSRDGCATWRDGSANGRILEPGIRNG